MDPGLIQQSDPALHYLFVVIYFIYSSNVDELDEPISITYNYLLQYGQSALNRTF